MGERKLLEIAWSGEASGWRWCFGGALLEDRKTGQACMEWSPQFQVEGSMCKALGQGRTFEHKDLKIGMKSKEKHNRRLAI